ncbi:uncharacterized protein PFL1_03453 [Pseudozyma flocculosa PF-1]|uniref:AB hydrolase-1 domain-containing protein n=2 Tax=Pseudozyma flocculosa TaxID=84751 RepID=A0A5C3FD30_9BASI|nr:uncharacterized protein PFL1_03453 [Pseudozyma flocculosa PF-1]EPQ29166.1 hypothetical protein PFL1_03453 [Pseudozyma flocculosa PF-1]SPO41537.1 uncharacterized protein PSFLO_07019 [Pseudozyma flocculosa]
MLVNLLPLALSALSLASAASISIEPRDNAAPVAGPYGLGNAQCQPVKLRVPIDAKNQKFTDVVQQYSNTSYATAQMTEFATAQANYTSAHLKGDTVQNKKTYSIQGYYCTPRRGAKEGSALINLVHGIGFDASYWDFTLSPEYSFVKHAASHGYSTFRYDRLGTGKSQTPSNGFDETQAPTEVAILAEVLRQLRDTTNVGGKKHPKVVGVGHSYGSVQTQAITATRPELLDAAILTGYTNNVTNLPGYLNAASYSVAADVLPHLASKPRTWLASGSEASDVRGFFYPPYYSEQAFKLARSTEQAVTLGSLFTIGLVGGPAPNFNKPVQVVNGAKDFIFCSSNCWGGPDGTDIPSGVKQFYPAASKFSSFIAENVGHGITAHYAQPMIAEKIIEFISQNGL